MNFSKVQKDFDEIACLSEGRETRSDRYDSFLVEQVPADAVNVLEIGCGLGHLTTALATGARKVTGVDFSPEMIARARERSQGMSRVSFLCGDFLQHDFGSETFDCVISAATLHHLPEEIAVSRMVALLRPAGRLVIHDLRASSGTLDQAKSLAALAHVAATRFLRTGILRRPRAVRDAYDRHRAGETYLTLQQARALADRLLPGARVFHHWLWRYTIVWDKRLESRER